MVYIYYQPCPLIWHVLMGLHMLELSVGKDRQVITTALQYSVATVAMSALVKVEIKITKLECRKQ